MAAFWAGLGTGLSLIVAIGAQNAFVLRQGLIGRHVFALCLFCAVSDAMLIALGVAGMGAIMQAAPGLALAMRVGGAIFLTAYGVAALRRAWRGGQSLEAARAAPGGLWRVLGVAVALTWVNPHVYLDTVVLLGSVATRWPDDRLMFATGAICGSFLFFFSLGYGARLLAPLFARPASWRVLDAGVGALMLGIAGALVAQ